MESLNQTYSRIGEKYLLLRTLGQGTFGKVKLAVHAETNELVAIKILMDRSTNEEVFLKEINLMSLITHPNVLRLIEYNNDGIKTSKTDGSVRTVAYAVVELAQGGEIFDYVAETGRFSERVSRYFFRQIIEGLEACHNKGVSHRDLKPENILLDEFYNIKLADFGWAAPLEGRDGEGFLRT